MENGTNYELEIKDEADKIFEKLASRNSKQMEIIEKKIKEIRETPYGYKYLRQPLHGFNRVHIDKSYVLIFGIDHKNKTVTVYHYDHHDHVYKWRPN